MGKRVIISFIYDGCMDWMLRVPITPPKGSTGKYNSQWFQREYYSKKEYTFKQVLDRRLELVKQFEDEGKRIKPHNHRGKWISSQLLIEEERDGKYDKYLR